MSEHAEQLGIARAEVVVPLAPAAAFARFAGQLGAWWPREYTWSGAVLDDIGIEPRVDGMCWERGPHGFRCDWGRVLAWDPPSRLVLAWQIAPSRAPEPNPSRASEIEVRFEPIADGSTRVTLEHRHFDRHGEGGGAYRDGMASPMGWPRILEAFTEHEKRDRRG